VLLKAVRMYYLLQPAQFNVPLNTLQVILEMVCIFVY